MRNSTPHRIHHIFMHETRFKIPGKNTAMFCSNISALFICFFSIANLITSIHGESFDQDISSLSVEDKMKKLGIIPYVIPEPPTIVDIAYKYYLRKIYLQDKGDDTIPHHKLSKIPTIYWMDCDPRKYYSLFMTLINISSIQSPNSIDFDPENLGNAKQYHSMLYTNIAYCNLKNADEIFTYEAPPANENNETRIYLFLLMEQKDGTVHMGFKEEYNYYLFRDENHHNSYRSNFTIKEFMDHFETKLAAGNYMRVITPPKQPPFSPSGYFSNLSHKLKTYLVFSS